jgi:[ribosomal protein S5]-alanine N-acetyltransferase
MNPIPSLPSRLETERLVLRPFTSADAPLIADLAGRHEIADTTATIPHPYSEGYARDFILRQAGLRASGKALTFAIQRREDSQLIGAGGLRDIDRENEQAELGFWIGVNHWRRGYATEGARGLLAYAFTTLELNRVYAHHMVRNPASGRVLEKAGMQREGVLRQRLKKWGVFEDVVLLAILRRDWQHNAT